MRFLKTLSFYKMLFMNKLEFSSLTDCFIKISETIGVVWFSVKFSYFNVFLILFLWGKDVFISEKRVRRERTMLLSKVNKAKPPPTFICCCRNLKSKEPKLLSNLRFAYVESTPIILSTLMMNLKKGGHFVSQLRWNSMK